MRRRWLALVLLLVVWILATPAAPGAAAAIYYVRGSAGNDTNDGRAPVRSFQTLHRAMLSLRPGDTLYVGPGLYRDELQLANFAADAHRTVIVADTEGRRVGESPGPVVIAGSDPVGPRLFERGEAPGTYTARLPAPVYGVVEMDGPQARYLEAQETDDFVFRKVPEDKIVASVPSTWRYDGDAGLLYIHTSDGRPPGDHRMEIIRRRNGFFFNRAANITVKGFVLRHSAMAGIEFFNGSDGGLALDNLSFGHHQGIQVHSSRHVRVVRNVLFRNTNSGLYFLAKAAQGLAAGNEAFENVKGIRVGSDSVGALILENRLFANQDAGLAIEHANGAQVWRNHLADNDGRQLLVVESDYVADYNCYASVGVPQLIADFFTKTTRFERLEDYQRASGQDLHARAGGCEIPHDLPDVLDFEAPPAPVPRVP
jgi:hypothetical protein